MRVGVAYWQGRVSPVFDEARHLVVVTIAAGREIGRDRLLLQTRNLWDRVRILSEQGVDVLLCGAISSPLEKALEASGIRVFGFLTGEWEPILASFLDARGPAAFPEPADAKRRPVRRIKAGAARPRPPLRRRPPQNPPSRENKP
ncbi:MAG: NifB/NifX family molybdenum-iron cluster-binding protein [Desulfobacterales bacterium]